MPGRVKAGYSWFKPSAADLNGVTRVQFKMGSSYLILSAVLGLCIAYLIRFSHEKNPNSEAFLARTTDASNSALVRMMQAVGLQLVGRNPTCTFKEGELKGQLVLLSGGNSGIGYETALGLLRRGADVIMVGRNERKVDEAIQKIRAQLISEGYTAVPLQYIITDMSDLNSVVNLIRVLHHHFGARQIDQLILNAAVWPQEYSTSAQGYEVAFATNVAGPHLLLRALTEFNILKPNGRVISITGDIYITLVGTADEGSSENFIYSTPAGSAGQTAYSRSKLGAMWLVDTLHGFLPQLQMYHVHPGVMDNTLSGNDNPLPKALMISNEQGAQTTLICATADAALLENGAYYHNTLGKLVLQPTDPAKNAAKAQAFWQLVEGIIAPYMRALGSSEQQAQE
jgi:NAD(P)-dependent dehydrogenase (short-subunit alcohol dehydrogenase family)